MNREQFQTIVSLLGSLLLPQVYIDFTNEEIMRGHDYTQERRLQESVRLAKHLAELAGLTEPTDFNAIQPPK